MSSGKALTENLVRECEDHELRLSETLASLGKLIRQVQFANGTKGKVDSTWLIPKLKAIRETGVMETFKAQP